MFCDRPRVRAGRVTDDDSTLRGRVDVDVVQACSVFRDDLQSIRLRKHIRIEFSDSDDDGIVPSDICERSLNTPLLVHTSTLRKISNRFRSGRIYLCRNQNIPCFGHLPLVQAGSAKGCRLAVWMCSVLLCSTQYVDSLL